MSSLLKGRLKPLSFTLPFLFLFQLGAFKASPIVRVHRPMP
jgi:hypothetical protein